MQNTKVRHYLSSNYVLTRPKMDLKRLLDPKGFVSSFVRDAHSKEKVFKVYYDNQGFFTNIGIHIGIIHSSSLRYPQLVIRLETKVERLMFLQDMPEKFIKDIGPKDSIRMHQAYIVDCINAIYPNGLDTNVAAVVAGLRPVMTVTRKQDKVRMINNQGLKFYMHYGNVEYHNMLNGEKSKQFQFEIVLDMARQLQQYYDLIHKIEVQVPNILKIDSSDIVNGQEYTKLGKRQK